METPDVGQNRITCPNCGTPVIVGGLALGLGARPQFRAGGRRDAPIAAPLVAGLCPTCRLVSMWAQPSEALRALLRLHSQEPTDGSAESREKED